MSKTQLTLNFLKWNKTLSTFFTCLILSMKYRGYFQHPLFACRDHNFIIFSLINTKLGVHVKQKAYSQFYFISNPVRRHILLAEF